MEGPLENEMNFFTDTTSASAIMLATITTVLTVAFTSLRRKRNREDLTSIDIHSSESKRAKLDEAASSSNLFESSPTPAAPLGEEAVADLLENEIFSLPNLTELGNPDPSPDLNYPLYEAYNALYMVICKIVDTLPLVLPNPEKVTLFEITRVSLLEEETDLVVLSEMFNDLYTLGNHSEYFNLFLDCLQHCLSFC